MSELPVAHASDDEGRPIGREEVIEATTRAAIDLFSRSNPSQVSVREIASRAGVSHALVHRYMGSKDDIFHAALKMARDDAGEVWNQGHGMSGAFALDHPAGRYMHIIVRGTLDGMQIGIEELKLPHAQRMVEMLQAAPLELQDAEKGFDARLVFSASLGLLAAMDTAEDFFLAQSGLDAADKGVVRAELGRLVLRILAMSDPAAAID